MGRKIPIEKLSELHDFVEQREENHNSNLSSYIDQINTLEIRTNNLENQLKSQPTSTQRGERKMDEQKLLQNLQDIADVNKDGQIDKVDVGMFFKYLATIYSSLVALISALFGINESYLKTNWTIFIVLLIVSILATILIIYIKDIISKKDKKIQSVQEKIVEQGKSIIKMEYNAMETEHKHNLELLNKDFVLRVRDEMLKDEYNKLIKNVTEKKGE